MEKIAIGAPKEFVIYKGVLSKYNGPGGEVELPSGVTKIGKRAFYGCEPIQKVILPEGVAEIRECAFLHQKSLEEVIIPEGLEQIGHGAFYGCTSLKRINLPESLTRISDGVFERCTGLEEISLPGGLRVVSETAFWGCTSLKAVTMGEGVEKLCTRAFERCGALQEVTLPESLTKLGYGAFLCCESLSRVTVPGSLSKVDGSVFAGCASPVLRAPRTPVNAFAKQDRAGAATGFAELRQEGVTLNEDIEKSYLRYIKASKSELLPKAIEHPSLLRLLLREKLISPNDDQFLQEEAERQGNTAAKAILQERIKKSVKTEERQ